MSRQEVRSGVEPETGKRVSARDQRWKETRERELGLKPAGGNFDEGSFIQRHILSSGVRMGTFFLADSRRGGLNTLPLNIIGKSSRFVWSIRAGTLKSRPSRNRPGSRQGWFVVKEPSCSMTDDR